MPDITWTKEAQDMFEKVITALPQFHRSIAQKLVKESAEEITKSRGLAAVEEKELVEAFFQEIPPAFKEMMKRLFHKLSIDYTKYIKE